MYMRISVFLVAFLLPSFLSVSVVYAHGDEAHDVLASKVSVCHSLSEAEKGSCYELLCEDTSISVCAEDIVDSSFSGSGPKFAFAVLNDLPSISFFSPLDGYGLAVRIGALLAREHGPSGEVFLRCPSDFRYGCSYGFFSEIIDGEDISSLASTVCSSLSSPDMCYHRTGHAFMKHSGHDSETALRFCDGLSDPFRFHCWDGVFMEGVHEILGSGGVFAANDPLVPCSRVSDRYRGACYGNHGAYLLRYFGDSVEDAMHACEGAGEYVSICKDSFVSDGHAHHDRVSADERSWFQQFLDFILSFFLFDTDAPDSGAHDTHSSDEHAGHNAMPPEPAAVVVYRDGAYIPSTVHVSVGDSVLWVNEDSVFWPASNLHPTHRLYPGSTILKCHTESRDTLFDACEAMGPGAEYSFVFDVAGEWQFHDHINPRARGFVIVSE